MLSTPATAPAHVVARPAIVRVACPRARPLAECGFVRVPLDRRFPHGRTIRIYFEHYFRAQRSAPATSTVLSIEGGPGFSTTADRAARLQLWRPISARRDLLLVDLRGTGRSGALNCPAFRRHILPYIARAGRCAAQLGPSRDDYDTSQSVQDLARGAERDRRRQGRPVRRLVRVVRGPGLRDPLPAPAAVARARRHLPAARLRPGPRRHRREHAELARRWPARAVPAAPRAAIRWR